jgi:hypothetical protein
MSKAPNSGAIDRISSPMEDISAFTDALHGRTPLKSARTVAEVSSITTPGDASPGLPRSRPVARAPPAPRAKVVQFLLPPDARVPLTKAHSEPAMAKAAALAYPSKSKSEPAIPKTASAAGRAKVKPTPPVKRGKGKVQVKDPPMSPGAYAKLLLERFDPEEWKQRPKRMQGCRVHYVAGDNAYASPKTKNCMFIVSVPAPIDRIGLLNCARSCAKAASSSLLLTSPS